MAQSENRLLAALPPAVFAAIEPHLKTVELKFADILTKGGDEVRYVYFPHSGVVSLVVELDVGHMIETAMIGRDGVVSAAPALDGKLSLNKAVVQLRGTASRVGVDRFRKVARKFEAFRNLLNRHEQLLLAQSQQSAACNASHQVEARMCRWLLWMRDLSGSDDLPLTQEFLAQMLGVQRTTVSVVANTLQKGRLIQYTRGNIRLLDIRGLKKESCECYGTVRAHYEKLLGQ